MEVSVYLPDGQKRELSLPKSAIVKDLRDRIAALCPKVPRENLLLMHKGIPLDDREIGKDGKPGRLAKLYNHYNFTDFETVQVQVRNRRPVKEGKSQAKSKKKEVPASMPEPVHQVQQGEQSSDVPAPCERCNGKPGKCCLCGCKVCKKNTDEANWLLCDGYEEGEPCNLSYHIYCLTPKLKTVPQGDWFCPTCTKKYNKRQKATRLPGQGAKLHRKRASAPSAKTDKPFGYGISCARVTNKRQDVDTNIEGPIPGVEVGQSYDYRNAACADRVHCFTVQGIAQNCHTNRAVSIVASGGYEDDKDKGDELIYTGEGGRDLKEATKAGKKGNRRTGEQRWDQTLTKNNLALARSCHGYGEIEENSVQGGDAKKHWKKSGPVRVIRGRGKKRKITSQFEPEQGYRYDGIYKMVRFYPVVGQSGFRVWQFVLRRDDPAPAPWTAEGKASIEELGLKMKLTLKKQRKRKREGNREEEEQEMPPKRAKMVFSAKTLKLMEADAVNEHWWQGVREAGKEGLGHDELNDKITDLVRCSFCFDTVSMESPVTLSCKHNFCRGCLKNAIKHNTEAGREHSCPNCRKSFTPANASKVNNKLKAALKAVMADLKL